MTNSKIPHHHTAHNAIEHLSLQLNKIEDFETVSEVFKQLGDSTRVRIFWLLCHCEECVADIASLLDMSSPAVSHHLRVLKNCKLITSTRSGKEVYYKASENTQSKLMHQMIEQVMEISCLDDILKSHDIYEQHLSGDHDQVLSIHKVHDYLTNHLDERITIEELSRKFLMNPTTLKSLFKETYGDSIASHIKAHRLEHAATLLTETDKSLNEIAKEVGYESQSKFSSAFKEAYGMLPSEYRKNN